MQHSPFMPEGLELRVDGPVVPQLMLTTTTTLVIPRKLNARRRC